MPRIQIKRGLKANLPTSGMLPGEQYYTTDRSAMYVATDATTKKPVVPPIDDLQTIPSISGAEDLLLIHDASETTGLKEKKITFNDFKTALNIPEASTDEKVAVVAGGTAGYIWGTDGTNGVIRMGSTMTWTKDSGNAFVTIDVSNIDCGTF
ncbi:hypothetical protein D9V84_11290 [Bacteroidetes/Chlorobi group bacterium Naka2016]|jgi:hypothetical protein|nr:MAG: hypothetical protein D9V84_11290 [Bacteroidetes/Chlorobi group bacterium Naka2016]